MADYSVNFRSIRELRFAEEAESTALKFALIFAATQAVAVLIGDWARESVPLSGEWGSVASHALISALIISLIVSPIAYIRGIRFRNSEQAAALRQRRNLGVAPLTIGVMLLSGLLIITGFSIIGDSFIDLSLDIMSTMMALTILAAGLAYIITKTLMLAHTSALFVNLSVFYLFATLFFSTYFQENPQWWQRSFSYLGMTDSNSKMIFNVGLVYTGILVVIWQAYFMEKFTVLLDIGVITPRTHQIIRWALILAGILLAFVGIFRFGISPFFNVVHDVSATGMGVMVGLLMLFLRRLVNGYRPIFYMISITMVVLIVISAVLKVMGVYNLVGLELIAFVLAGLWLVLFERSTSLLVDKTMSERQQAQS